MEPSLPQPLVTAVDSQPAEDNPDSHNPDSLGFKRSSSSLRMQQFEVGDLVKVECKGKPWYGVIRWIGSLPNVEGSSAGIEMV